ncbi:hypothetical protein AYK24_00375 [Thermoplasmatales archaeon SG8-52-4]|nr:MAG: hypothetical protein AYK24_00375 [Thermoplasmatales archaeon SG8-52-4]
MAEESKTQLHQHLAAEPNVKEKERNLAKEAENTLGKKQHHFAGRFRVYQPKEEGGEQFPPETEPLVTTVQEKISYYFDALSDAINHSIVKEETNAVATANLVYEGYTIAENLHATSLLSLENKLKQLRSLLMSIPTLDPKFNWKWDKDNNYYKTDPLQTFKSKKVPKVLVKYEATKEHPAQTELVHEDMVVGTWNETKVSGAITPKMKSEILSRHDKWELAVKDARQRANNAKIVEDEKLGKIITGNILHGGLSV